jgi:hypothetical protein
MTEQSKIDPDVLTSKLEMDGIRVGYGGYWGFRAVTHYWIDDAAVEKTLQAFRRVFKD